jgi:N-acetylmuramoyl-L-alanine amidase
VATVTPAPIQSTATPVPTPTSIPTPEPSVEADKGETVSGPTLPFSLVQVRAMVTTTGIPVEVIAAVRDRRVIITPCGRATTVAVGDPLVGIQVVIDPGHGGPADTGAVGPNGLVERDLNMDLSLAIQDELVARGITVVLTRSGDYLTLLSTRAGLADALSAELMVSIHHNAPVANPSLIPGTEVFVQSGSEASARLGGLLYEVVVGGLSALDDVAWTSAPDAGVLRVLNTKGTDAYGMIARPETPTALLELGYIASASEAAAMAGQDYIDVASDAVADAIQQYLETDNPGSGFIDEPRVFDPERAPGAEVCTDPPLE